jgi:hypothetical protein
VGDNTVVTLVIAGDKYNYLKNVLRDHKDFISKLGVAEVVKENLAKDMHIVRTILETGEKKGA